MKYIYDIVLNFQDNYYEFYEWKRKDKLKNIKKIPLYRVSSEDILILKNNILRIDKQLLNRIKEDNKKQKKIMCLVSNTKISMGLLFDETGQLLKRSCLIYEEEDEVNNSAKDLDIININYIENKKTKISNELRLEKEKKEYLNSYITNNKDIKTLKYLYYEYFNKEINDILAIKKSLKKEINKTWTKQQNNLYNTVKLLNKKNLPMK